MHHTVGSTIILTRTVWVQKKRGYTLNIMISKFRLIEIILKWLNLLVEINYREIR
jgi:hypothetical protein